MPLYSRYSQHLGSEVKVACNAINSQTSLMKVPFFFFLPTVKCMTPFLNGNQTDEENPKHEFAELLQVTVSILSMKG